ncbi:MAG: primase, catalytic core [Acidimicrobiaceae bacterium]|jgi:DNA primase|nr:primase, catalytic core [Acidimicrobiaceae bacterium]
MAIPDEDVAQVRAATDMVALVGEHTALKRVGRRFVGLCPFHSEKSGSFSVNAEEGLYYCFGCQASGDAITFVRAIEGCDFVEAVERLAARAGVTVRNEEDARAGIERGRRKQLYDAVAAAVDFYHERLLNGRDAGLARQYLRARGYDGDVVRQFRLGFAPTGYDELVRKLKLPSKLLVEAGLAFDGQGRPRDAFRERVIFPIFDPGGRPIALGGRVLPPELRRSERDPGPKYRNSAESPIYQKRRTLYGLNWGKTDMARVNEAVVCEGYTDVVGFFRAGVPRAVATCGTSLTEDHFRLLANFAKRIVLAFDADSAGQNAAARLYEWERRHDVELAVASLPAGSDPAELASTDPAALADAVRGARPFLGFQVDRAIAAVDLGSPEGRSRAAQAALGAVAEHPDDLVRDHYLVEIADRTHHDPAKLRSLLDERRRLFLEQASAPAPRSGSRAGTRSEATPQAPAGGEWPAYDEPEEQWVDDAPPSHGSGAPARRPGAGTSPGRPRSSSPARSPRAGLEAIALAIHRPAEVAELFDEVIFVDPVQRQAFQALAGASHLHEAIDSAPPEVADLLRRLAVTDLQPDADPEGTFVALVRGAVESALVAMNGEARRGEAAGAAERLRTVAAVKEELELLRDPSEIPGTASPAIGAARRLVAWMAQREGNRE